MTALFLCVTLLADARGNEPQMIESIDIEPVWAGHPVGFCLLTQGEKQFAAYYNAERKLIVAARKPGEREWVKALLPEQVGWDSHNYVTLAIDDDGFIHLSGNMHCVPLKYYRTTTPGDIATFAPAKMVGEREGKCTYPEFFRGAKDELIFTYRDGSSGNGDQLYNVYNAKDRTWRRLLETPLTAGEGKMNAYFEGPTKGPDGRFHLCWVWRDTPDCATNHDPCYARSADLAHWETAAGKPLDLPITIATAEIVDRVSAHGGIINGNVHLGFDSRQRPVVSYHKFDAAGNTQIYSARFEDNAWKVYQTSDWAYRWEFGGGGAVSCEIGLSGVSPHGDGRLRQSYRHPKEGSGVWLLDETNFKPVGPLDEPRGYPRDCGHVASTFPGMQIQRENDLGNSGEPGVKYFLQWETLGPNRDRPREGEPPPASMLRLYKIKIP